MKMKKMMSLLVLLCLFSFEGKSQDYDLPKNILLLGKNHYKIPARNYLPLVNNWGLEYGTAYLARIFSKGKVMIAGGREGGYFYNYLGFHGKPFATGDLMRVEYKNILNIYASYNILNRRSWKHSFYLGLGPTFRQAHEAFFDFEIPGDHYVFYGRVGNDWGGMASLDYLFRPFRHWVIMPSLRYYTYPFWQNELPFPDPRIVKPRDMVGYGLYVGVSF